MTAIAVDETFIGAADLYIDDVLAGPTRDDAVFRVIEEMGTPQYNGVRGPLARTDYKLRELAEMEFTLADLSAAKMPIAIPAALVTAQNADGRILGGGFSSTLAASSAVGATNIKLTALTNLAVGDVIQIGPSGPTREFRKVLTIGTVGSGGTGFDLDAPLVNAHANAETADEVESTILAADSAPGANNIKVAAVSTYAVGDFIRIGYPAEAEVRKILIVGTLGAGGTGLTLEVPLAKSHRSGDNVVEITTEGGSLIEQSTSRRLIDADYHKFELRKAGVSGRERRWTILKGVNVTNAEYTAQDTEDPISPRIQIQSRINPDVVETSPWSIRVIPAA